MKALPYVLMPDQFTYLLRANMTSNGPLYRDIHQYFYQRRGLHELVQANFSEIDPYGSADKLVKALGWQGFRNRLAAIYLNYMWSGRYDGSQAQDLIQEVVAIEEILQNYGVQNYSRGFLLGFYLKSAEVSGLELDEKWRPSHLLADEELRGMLKAMGSRVIKIDWLILQLLHFRSYLGFKKLAQMLNRACSYAEIYGELDIEQREEMASNMLVYGASIGESEIFIERPV